MARNDTNTLDIRRILEDCIDSLEYVNRAHPEATGRGVRAERIVRAKAYLDTLPNAPGSEAA